MVIINYNIKYTEINGGYLIGKGAPDDLILERNLWFFNNESGEYSEVDENSPTFEKYKDELVMNRNGITCKIKRKNLRWNCSLRLARKICCKNRHNAETKGSWERNFLFLEDIKNGLIFYDSKNDKPLFKINRNIEDWKLESKNHGWPSFRDNEVIKGEIGVLPNGEVITKNGVHLGHNIPDTRGNRYCINLVSIAGNPESN